MYCERRNHLEKMGYDIHRLCDVKRKNQYSCNGGMSGLEIKTDDIPKNVKTIQFVNPY